MNAGDDIDLRNLTRGDKSTWDQFVTTCAPIVYAAIRKTYETHAGMPDNMLVEDLSQDVFAKLVRDDFRVLKRYNARKASLSTWLTVIARHTTVDYLRRQRLSLRPLGDDEEVVMPTPEPGPERPAYPPELLTPRQELILHLLYDQEMDVAEAAEWLKISPQTVRSGHHKAMKRLRAYFRRSAASGK